MTDFVYYVDLGGNTGIDMFCSEECLMKVWKLTTEEVGGEKISMSEHVENNYSKDERCFSCDKLLMTPAPGDALPDENDPRFQMLVAAIADDDFERVTFVAGAAEYMSAGDGQTLEQVY